MFTTRLTVVAALTPTLPSRRSASAQSFTLLLVAMPTMLLQALKRFTPLSATLLLTPLTPASTGTFHRTTAATTTIPPAIPSPMLVVLTLAVLNKLPKLLTGFTGVACGEMSNILTVIEDRAVLLE